MDQILPPTVNIVPCPVQGGVAETHFSGMQFSLVSKDNEQCNQFFRCKEFLLDVINATVNNKPIELYGFRYNPNHMPQPDMESAKVMIRNIDDPNFEARIPRIVDFLNKIETALDLKLTVIQRVENAQFPTFLLNSSRRWLEAPPMLSLFTLLIRCGAFHSFEDTWEKTLEDLKNLRVKSYQKGDNGNIYKCFNLIKDIVTKGYRTFFFKDIKKNYPNETAEFIVHDYSGIVSMAEGDSEYNVKYWTRPELSKKLSLAERRAMVPIEA